MDSRLNDLLDNLKKEFGWSDVEGTLEIRNCNDEIINVDLISDVKILDMRDIGRFLETMGKLYDDGYFGVGVSVVDPVTGEFLKSEFVDPETGEPFKPPVPMTVLKSAFVKLKSH